MAQSSVSVQDIPSNDNSLSTKEFLQNEKNCEIFKDSDEEIKMILSEINKLSGNNNNNLISGDLDDVDLILKRAEDIASETKNLLKSPIVSSLSGSPKGSNKIPEIKVTKPDFELKVDNKIPVHKVCFINLIFR